MFSKRIRQFYILINMGLWLTACANLPTNGYTEMNAINIAHYKRLGNAPSVVFESGLGDGKSPWSQVIKQLPSNISLFAYDRAGYEDSELGMRHRDPCSTARELHELLKKESVAPPYILVGHSLGGLYAVCFSKLYAKETAGLVLIDPTHPNHWKRMQTDAPIQAALVNTLRSTLFTTAMRQEFDAQNGCLSELNFNAPIKTPSIFLFSGQFRLEELGVFEQMLRKLRTHWLSMFTDQEHRDISDSGHYIQRQRPDVVVEAIQTLIKRVSLTTQNLKTTRF